MAQCRGRECAGDGLHICVKTKPPPTSTKTAGLAGGQKTEVRLKPQRQMRNCQVKTRVHWGMKAVCLCGKPAERCLSNIFQDLSFFFFFKILYKEMLHRGPVTAIASQTLHQFSVVILAFNSTREPIQTFWKLKQLISFFNSTKFIDVSIRSYEI